MMGGYGNGDGYHDRWQMMNGWGDPAAWIMLVLVVLVLAGATVAIISTLRQPRDTSPTHPRGEPQSSARQALDERFARGEIDEDEYRHRRNILLEA